VLVESSERTIAEIRGRFELKLEAARLEMSPFPHVIIEDLFHDDVYEKILRYNPFKANAGAEWFKRSVSANVSSRTPYYARKQINFHAGQPFDAPSAEQAFWESIKGCFLSDDWFERMVHDKFSDYFSVRFGDLTHESDFYSLFKKELFLQRHEPGFYIGPHTDVPTRIFTCIFSFAEGPGFEQFGTELLAPKDRLKRCWGLDHYPPTEFTVEKLAPYKPNNCLIFFKTRHSFHSVRAIDDTVPNQRYGMQFQYYEPGDGLFNDLSKPDLMSRQMVGNRGVRQQTKTLIKTLVKSARRH
jgi:hypothetical protein